MSSKRVKINNENSEIKEKERREMINNLSEMINNISEDNNNNDWLDKSCKIIKMLLDENETLKEESYGFKYISEEQKKHTMKLDENFNELKQHYDSLSNKLKAYESQNGGFNNNIVNLIKTYSKNITDDRKKEIQEKYNKYIYFSNNTK